MMSRLNLFLVAMVVICALSVVNAQQRARRAFIDVEQAQALTRKLEIEWNSLQVEQGQLGKPALIDTVARRDLKMMPVTPGRTIHLDFAQAKTQLNPMNAVAPEGKQ
jgi:cell division protein FtsL